MVTVICCYNNLAQYKDFLLASVQEQDTECEMIGIDNTGGRYKGAAEAYNHVWPEAKGDVLVFCHQDIAFPEKSVLSRIEAYLNENEDTIVGFAGMLSDKTVISNLKYRKTQKYITKHQVAGITDVEVLDECCFACKKAALLIRGGV